MIEIVDKKVREQENLLMETAMRIQEVFDDMWYAHQINPDTTDYFGYSERYTLFCDWAKKFEERYCDTERYTDDFLELSREFAEEKIKEVFG